MEQKKTVYIERNALFRNIAMLLCNNITEADTSFLENNYNLFYKTCEACEGNGEIDGVKCDECYGEGQYDLEAYQYFLCSVNEQDIDMLKSYGVELGYSELLDLHVMPVYDYGTSWSEFSYSKEVEKDYKLSFDETEKRETAY